jgi:D-alanyl-lipoteichoic acid acyltransferase DltB (MBOAT superfamily)
VLFGAALAIGAAVGDKRKLATALGIAINLLLLGVFKYADFAVGTLNAVLHNSDAFALPGLALPLGISFFTFHSISYLVDVHRGQVVANRSPLEVAVYALTAVMTGWVWFRARHFDHALTFFASLLGINGWTDLSLSTHTVLHPVIIAAMVVGILLATVRINISRVPRLATAQIARPSYAVADMIAIAVFLGLAVLSVAAGSYSPFLYFRF